ncbi:DNA-binding transcriptional regulator, HxlR family [Mucilaginibacter gossypiicola]|uniref:DNA-binding transcriptional regulator, HxlR family n=1 Tax=Mucilaginibacter gossypiicola TaxID=551995 RepID=A0A1H8B964_9SPHI|nr:helix-turn-helix domain-containing protein [Mucilaginibacter gossypiicola]SEM78939.1 DNA-binding transcriptional regulator, HxlR family [Mucilaginibacter gossypiicola]
MLAEKIIEKKAEPDCDCSIIGSINIISGKWKPVIIWTLLSGPRRFGELYKAIDGIALKVLSRHLKELEADGIINRKVYAEVPPKVEYTLTEKGMSLNDVMQLLAEWGKKNIVAE